jgi:hypothetical protein
VFFCVYRRGGDCYAVIGLSRLRGEILVEGREVKGNWENRTEKEGDNMGEGMIEESTLDGKLRLGMDGYQFDF